jgi:voltage-gated potassium channel
MAKLPVSTQDLLGAAALAGGGAAFALVERSARRRVRTRDGLWWAFATATTVGYGDVTPRTDAGRVLGAALMLQRAAAARRRSAREHAELSERLDEVLRRLDALERRGRPLQSQAGA